MKSKGLAGDGDAEPNETHPKPRHVAFLDLDRIRFEPEPFKAGRGRHNPLILKASQDAGPVGGLD